ncbi:MAG: PrsW family intramembrane metalloprotease [Armatimonadota bacterium]|nr:PrsW family intramembrane metalloprotease [Armatimonadota bacterium]
MAQGREAAVSTELRRGGDISERGLRYLVYAGLGVLFFFFGMGTLIVFLHTAPLSALLLCTVAAILPVPIYAAVILWLDRHEKEPTSLLLAAFFWGAIVATFISLLLNTGAGVILRAMWGPRWATVLTPSIVAPVVEESSKGLALLLLFLAARGEFNNLIDGLVYGGLVGLGFAMTENVLYFARAYTQGGIAGLGLIFIMRVILSGFIHPLFTGAIGAGLGYAREAPGALTKVGAPLLGYACGMLGHALWNATASLFDLAGVRPHPLVAVFVIVPAMSVVLALPALVLLVWLAVAGWKREVRIIREQLRDEIGRKVVTEGELAVLGDARARSSMLTRTLIRQGPGAWMALRQLYELQVDLAFRKWHAARGEKLTSFQQATTEDEYRQRIGRIRDRLAAMGVTSE